MKENEDKQPKPTQGTANDDVKEPLDGRKVLEQLNRSKPVAAKPSGDQGGDDEDMSLKDVIKEQAIEGEQPQSRNLSLRQILGGDLLNTAAIRRQIWLFLLIAVFFIIYISNRYGCQQDIIELDQLQKELQDAKYKALSSTSQLTEKSRESNVLNMLKSNKDSTLKMPSQPPYIITVPEEK
jgi:hypothetical protein